MNTERKINALVTLGRALAAPDDVLFLKSAMEKAHNDNGWFTPDNIRVAMQNISALLAEENLSRWLSPYLSRIEKKRRIKQVAVIMAGNIPFVAFHDMLCVLMAGHCFTGKLSSKDDVLLPAVAKMLCDIEPAFNERITFCNTTLRGFDAVIATGGDNASRYFEYYFAKYPHIIRKNRNSLAVLRGDESHDELVSLGRDVFQYFGLGCRSVSKLYLPGNYNLDRIFDAFYEYREVIKNNKYANNYNYHRTIYLMNKTPFLENGFLILKKDEGLASPVAVLFYEYYSSLKNFKKKLNDQKEFIQCVVGKKSIFSEMVPFGNSQSPALWDYADGVDTMEFLFQ